MTVALALWVSYMTWWYHLDENDNIFADFQVRDRIPDHSLSPPGKVQKTNAWETNSTSKYELICSQNSKLAQSLVLLPLLNVKVFPRTTT